MYYTQLITITMPSLETCWFFTKSRRHFISLKYLAWKNVLYFFTPHLS